MGIGKTAIPRHMPLLSTSCAHIFASSHLPPIGIVIQIQSNELSCSALNQQFSTMLLFFGEWLRFRLEMVVLGLTFEFHFRVIRYTTFKRFAVVGLLTLADRLADRIMTHSSSAIDVFEDHFHSNIL